MYKKWAIKTNPCAATFNDLLCFRIWDTRSEDYEDIMPCSQLKINRRFERTCRLVLLATCFMLISCLAYFSTLKMEITSSSETSVDFQRTTWHCIPEQPLREPQILHVVLYFLKYVRAFL
jgi:hypothetical protein